MEGGRVREMMTKKEYATYIQKYVCEIEDISRLNKIFNYVSKEYVKDYSGTEESRSDSEEWIRYKAALDAVYKVEDPKMLELIERFARSLANIGRKGDDKNDS